MHHRLAFETSCHPLIALFGAQVHYGHASLAAVSQLPVLYVFPRQHVHVRHTATAVAGALRGSSSSSGSDSQGTAVVILDQALLHARGAFESALHELMIPHSWQVVMAGLSVQSSQQGQLASSQPPQPTTCTSSTGACSTAGITAAPAAVSTLPVTQTVQTSGRCCGATGGPCTAGSGSCSTTDTQGAGSTVPCATVQPALPDVACSTSKQQQQGVAGYTWSLPEGTQPESVVYVWVGPQDCITLQALQLTLNMGRWLSITPAATAEQGAHKGSSSSSTEAVQEGSTDGQDTGPAGVCCVQEGLVQGTQALLRRRYFLVEKAKDASIVGILVSCDPPAVSIVSYVSVSVRFCFWKPHGNGCSGSMASCALCSGYAVVVELLHMCMRACPVAVFWSDACSGRWHAAMAIRTWCEF